ncbi:uridine kinase [Agromyces flavus]|uniref:Uridine kinase n=1 Tax=Agromyces flavus TaxID=589382 RepID=A0A1H1VJ64_9MICO|nr:uridine kinase [Agromyces flavus]MCP2365950.1 uridine kinase [Agromyces flavus]GGI43703.1 uridine kinase [Agromyces flavus]SDS84908.1 uridine kinase [Agromyces flavus]
MTRSAVLDEVARRLSERDAGHPLRIGIDGVCGVGKSTFAEELVSRIGSHGRPAILLDSDGFHHVRAIRYRRGRDSARGYYEDAYDFGALREFALEPLGPEGSRRYAVRVHDLATDEIVREFATAPADAVVVFAATFLQRGDLRELWDEVVYLDAAIERAERRGIRRDAVQLGGADVAARAYASRYMAACRIYLDEEDPRSRASIVVDHDDPMRPRLVDRRD